MPPYLAGRLKEFDEFERLLEQDIILENMVLTGLRGVGKTVLLEAFRPRAIAKGWLWVGTDLSESASVSEETMATRLLADLAVATSTVKIDLPKKPSAGFAQDGETSRTNLSHAVLRAVYDEQPGLVADRLRAVLNFAWHHLQAAGKGRIIFAYDEAQNLSDNKARDQYPLSVLLDVFQSIQKQNIPFMLVLTGLPTLFPKLVEARTFAERMFHVVTLGRLDEAESLDAILMPIQVAGCPVTFNDESAQVITNESGGYPYFIQFICREVFDIYIQQLNANETLSPVPIEEIQVKLDTDFFAGRWAKATDRQRQLLWVIAGLDREEEEFTIQELVQRCKDLLTKPFSSSHLNQMLSSLGEQGLIYKNRFGKYSFAVPLLGKFILRIYAPRTTESELIP
jgi:AAA+ ATPase superfamily predicted ATPase